MYQGISVTCLSYVQDLYNSGEHTKLNMQRSVMYIRYFVFGAVARTAKLCIYSCTFKILM